MEGSKSKEILENVISKKSGMLDEQLATKFEHSLRNNLINLRNDLNSVKKLNKKELSKTMESVNETEVVQILMEKETDNERLN